MKIPTDLKHKPVIVAEDYSNIDGRSARFRCPRAVPGLAQWNDRGRVASPPRSGATLASAGPVSR